MLKISLKFKSGDTKQVPYKHISLQNYYTVCFVDRKHRKPGKPLHYLLFISKALEKKVENLSRSECVMTNLPINFIIILKY